jgi:hypothetical protein
MHYTEIRIAVPTALLIMDASIVETGKEPVLEMELLILSIFSADQLTVFYRSHAFGKHLRDS